MSDFQGQHIAVPGAADQAVDQGLRAFMMGVYNKLAMGLLVSAVVAYATANVPGIMELMYTVEGGRLTGYTPVGLAVAFAPLGLILFSMFAMRNPSPASANLLYWAIVVTVGAGLAVVLWIYTGLSIFTAFATTALAFGGLSLYGYTTKRNLGPIGSFLAMALIGLVVAFTISFFIPGQTDPTLLLIMNGAGVLISAGLIAWCTQDLKFSYYATLGDQDAQKVASTMGAMTLFIQFVNLFRFLLAFIGVRR